jgi:hypothetical protein
MDHTTQIDHSHHEGEGAPIEYLKFAGVIIFIIVASVLYSNLRPQDFVSSFMAVFFLVFGVFKLLDLPGFVMSYIGYDIIARKFTGYAYAYPFIELLLAAGHFFRWPYSSEIALGVMVIGAIGVGRQLFRGSTIKCACLGTYIKLPLTTVSLFENVLMAGMAAVMLAR